MVSNERALPDGRVELVDTTSIAASPLYNHDLAPVPIAQRRWTTYNYAALWVSMAHCIPTYMLASGLMAQGMNWGIFSLLAVIVSVLGGIGGFFIFLARKSASPANQTVLLNQSPN